MDKVTELVHDVLRKPQNFSQQYLFNKDYYKPSKQVSLLSFHSEIGSQYYNVIFTFVTDLFLEFILKCLEIVLCFWFLVSIFDLKYRV